MKLNIRGIIFSLGLILIIVYILLTIYGQSPEYKAEKLFYRATKNIQKITQNPDVIPPKLFTSVENDLNKVIKNFSQTDVAKTAQMVLIEFYIATNKYDKAITGIDTVISKPGGDLATLSKAHFLKATVYEKQDKWSKALEEYTTLKDRYANTFLGLQAALYIANHYSKAGDAVRAEQSYAEAAAFYSKTEKDNKATALGYMAATLLVQSYVGLTKFEDAGKMVQDIINNYPSPSTFEQQLPAVEFIYVKTLKMPQQAIQIYSDMKEKAVDNRFKAILEKRIEALKKELPA
ncbi:MAG: tetratricopeptide repeat protein [Candidatus Omnitrophota bacterium]